MNTPPNRYVQPEVSEARVERLWQNVAQRVEARPSRVWRWAVLGTALAGVAAGGIVWLKTPPSAGPALGGSERAVLADAKLETKSDELAVTLGDGSSVKLGSQSEVQVRSGRSSAISLQLARGELWCDVTHREERKFNVVAGDVEVRVVGTQFKVKTTAGSSPRVEVNVTRGVVEVVSARRPGIVARVAAGQSWIQEAEVVVSQPDPAKAAGSDSVEPAKRDAPQPSATPVARSGRELFEKAGESRRAGDAAAAAHAYEELLRLHPGDGRASLAAFELGRLRMDRLGDLSGAIAALERAVAMNIGPSFREDALARLVSAYASQGNLAACKRARDRYSSSYPAGVHAAAVANRCGSH
ncbi:MAG TPA: FecR domain-containing protein [Polyangiaceae bacterium]|nr:FecR domain-containing protein [Polyangiaceae bacterium]